MSEDVLAAIDGAIHDWTTSGDAMRHVPAEARWERPRPNLVVGRAGTFQVVGTSENLTLQFTAIAEGFNAAMRRLAEVMNRTATAFASFPMPTPKTMRRLHRAGIHFNGPPPLCVNGREYHRRQQARRKRR